MHRGGDSGERRIIPPSGGTRPPGLLPLPNAKLPLLLTWTTRPPLPSRGSARFALPPNPPPSHFQPHALRLQPRFPLLSPAPGAYCDATTRFHGLQGNHQSRECQPTTGKPGRRLAFACIPAPSRGATSDNSLAFQRQVWPPTRNEAQGPTEIQVQPWAGRLTCRKGVLILTY